MERHDTTNVYYLVDLIYELDERMQDKDVTKEEKIIIKSNLSNRLNRYNYNLLKRERA